MLATIKARRRRVLRGRFQAMKDRKDRCGHGFKLDMRPRPDLGTDWVEGWAASECKICPKDRAISIARKDMGPPTRKAKPGEEPDEGEEQEPDPCSSSE